MVSSKTRKTISLAISLLVVVISLTGIASAATAPAVTTVARYTPGFVGAPGKVVADTAGNLYVTDFWAKGIVKLDRQGNRIGFIPTASRPAAVAVLPDNRLVVAMSAPQKYVAFYAQTGSAPNVTGEEAGQFAAPANPYYRPSDIAIDAAGYIYVLDAGISSDVTTSTLYGRVRVYDSIGDYKYEFGGWTRSSVINIDTASPSNFKLPVGIAYEKANNQIVVVDTANFRLQFFTAYNGTACTFVKSIGVAAGKNNNYPQPGAALEVRFGGPTDVDFDYTAGPTLNRLYVADRPRNEVSVVDPVTGYDLMRINGTTVTGASMNMPASLLYRPAATGGLLYAGSDSSDAGINLVALGLDGGSISPTTVALAITSPVPATTTTGQSPLTVSGTVSPVVPVYCNVNGGADTLATPSGGNWSVSLALQEGYNYILCKASDAAPVDASTYFTFTVGNAVTPIVTSPATGVYTNNATVVINGTTSVPNANVKLTNANNTSDVSTLSGADGKWSASIDLAEGANVITVTSWKTGTAVGSTAVTVNADYTPPSVNVSFLANGSTTVSAIQNLDGIVVEKNLSSIAVNGANVATNVELPVADNTYFSTPVTLVRGSNDVTITVTDLAGNSASVTRTAITLDPEKPGLTVELPADNSYLPAAGAASANGTVDATFTAVDAAGTAATLAGGNWSTAAMAITNGFNSYQFTATDGTLSVSEKRTVIADAAYVQLAITNPPADLATNSASVILAGTVVGVAGNPTPTISIDGAAPVAVTSYNSGTGAFSHTVNFATEGEHTVKIIANAATTAVRNIIYDNTLPDLAIQSNTQAMPTLVTGIIEPSAKMKAVSASLKGVPVNIPISVLSFAPVDSNGSVVWHANLGGYTYDTLSFTTTDPAGNDKLMPYVKGIPTGDIDADGTVRLSDALACLRHVAGKDALSGEPRFQADVGSLVEGHAAQDGDVTVVDAVLILQKAYGLMTF